MTIERPDSCPREGQIEAFDAGWNAHEVGLSRKAAEVFSPSKYASAWAVLAWDVRDAISKRGEHEVTTEELVIQSDVRRAIKEAHHLASRMAAQTGARRDKRREDKLWAILKEMEGER